MFRFGKNWKSFLKVVDESRISQAVVSLQEMLGRSDLKGLSFLDMGCGSGLFSLAAVKLGAKNVLSIDYDVDSVECCTEIKRRFSPDAAHWDIRQGSVLDSSFLAPLGAWDVVYSWGVLHHTGNMMQAMSNVAPLVSDGGALFVSIYNDQGFRSRFWKLLKRIYNANGLFSAIILLVWIPYFFLRTFVGRVIRGQNPFSMFSTYKRNRGMSVLHDWIDWLGGYPFEVAKPEEIFQFFRSKGFVLTALKTCGGGLGCNEFVFVNKKQQN
jgi:2-polyprenyl-6-hydroxyphenyl methylase/3-demethylubiquinone-9 3-methyltransferase